MSQKSDIQKLYEAAEFARFDAAAGWPSEVTPAQLIALWVGHEYLPPLGEPQTVTMQEQDGRIVHQSKQPDPRTWERGTETEVKRKACKVAAAMLRDAGIETEERTEITPRPPLRVLRLNPVGTIEKEQPPEVRKWSVVTRQAVHQCLSKSGMPAPEYIRAWLALEREAPPAAVESVQDASASKGRPKREKQADRIALCVSECERRAAELGEPFDRENMPGTKAEFLDLLRALDAGLRSIKTVQSLDRYLKDAGCKWPLDASAQPTAAPLYGRIFPDAHMRTPGAVSPQRWKA